MKTKLTQISRTREIVSKDKNSAGEWVETIFHSKYYETPPYISIYKRILHYTIDHIFCLLFYIIIILTLIVIIGSLLGITNSIDKIPNSEKSDAILGIMIFFGYFLMPFIYYLLFESILGRTIGHFITGAIVLDEYGQKPTFKKILLRTICRYVPLDFISAIENRAWHDQWSNTLVFNKKKYEEFLLRLEIEGVVL